MDFVFRSHAAFVHGDMSDKPLREYPYEAHARSLALEYLTCKMIQKPSYYEISQKVGTTLRHYTRLLLPVCGPRAPMTRLYYATRYITVERDGERVMPPGEAEAGKD
jgi:hypothetical protein